MTNGPASSDTDGVSPLLPPTYGDARTRFRQQAASVGLTLEEHPLRVVGPTGEALTVDVVAIGSARPRRGLLVLSGVHGVEGFIGSALQTDLLGRLDPTTLPSDVAVVLVHVVNPWGMAHGRRQNESNVDLNRNWRRSERTPVHNDAYDVVHPLACPDTPELPRVEDLLGAAAALVDEHGLAWVRDAITVGQYRHHEGLHYGGERSEASTRILERVVLEGLGTVERLLTVDLHTGHGPACEVTLLSSEPPHAPQDEFLRRHLGPFRVEATVGNPDATTATKSGQIAAGMSLLLPDATCFGTAAEFGTTEDHEQLVATYHEQWVHRHGLRDDPRYGSVLDAYRRCFTPEDPSWAEQVLPAGHHLLDRAVEAVVGWTA